MPRAAYALVRFITSPRLHSAKLTLGREENCGFQTALEYTGLRQDQAPASIEGPLIASVIAVTSVVSLGHMVSMDEITTPFFIDD